MQFTTFALSALSIGSALAQSAGVTVHVVRVGSMNGSLTYAPNNIKAAVGDMVQFQFAPNNHTVTQSTFDSPCQPIPQTSNVTGVWSGFMPVSAASTTTPTYTVMVKNQTPMWLYCSQGKHCQNGMVMVINENTSANASRSLANYQALAKTATVNLPGGTGAAGGSNSTTGTGSGTGSGTGTGTGTGSGTGTGTGSGTGTTTGSDPATSTSGTPAVSATGAAHHVQVSSAMGLGSVVAVGLAFFL